MADAGGPYTGTAGQEIAFDGSRTSDPAGQVLTYAWDFGDGSTATGIAPSHGYAAIGSYTVTLVVTWGSGGTSSAQTKASILDATPSKTPTLSAHIVNHSDDPGGQTWITLGLLNSGTTTLKNVQVTSTLLSATALPASLPILLGDIGPAQEGIVSVSVSTDTWLQAGSGNVELQGSYSLLGQTVTFDFMSAIDADPGGQGQSRWATTNDYPGGPPLRASMEAPLLAGFLPAVEPGGSAKNDELAAELALKVSAGGRDAVGALMQALLTAGFQIRGPNGTFDSSILGDASPRQGLAIDGWEVASLSRQYAQEYGVGVHTLGKAVAAALPQLGADDLSPTLLADIQQAAVSSDPDLRFLARFIVELGRKGDARYDLLSTKLDVTQVRLDAIQNFLILVRLAGDMASVAPAASKVTPAAMLRPRDAATTPCSTDELSDTIINIGVDAEKTMFRGVIEELIKGATAEVTSNISAVLAAAKFLANYAFLSADLSMNGDALQRRKDTQPGERRTLTLKLQNDIGKWQLTNCGRFMLTMIGSDFSVFPEEQIKTAGIVWNLTDLPPPVIKGFSGYPMDLNFYANSPYVRFVGSTPATRGDSTVRTTASDGTSSVDIEGSPRGADLSNTLVRDVNHEFTVVTLLRLVNPPANGPQVADLVAKLLFAIAEVYLGGLETPSFWIENASEMAYRTYSYAPSIKRFQVRDYEPCNGVWSGDVTYEMQRHIVLNGNPAAGDVSQKIVDESWAEADHIIATDFDYDFNNEITSSVFVSVDAGYSTRDTENGEGFKILRDSDPPVSCETYELSAVGSGSSDIASQNGSIHIAPSGKYDLSFPVIPVIVSSSLSGSSRETCPAPRDQYSEQNQAGSAREEPEIIAIAGSGSVDPKDPNHIVGSSMQTSGDSSATVTTKVTWNLKRSCGKF